MTAAGKFRLKPVAEALARVGLRGLLLSSLAGGAAPVFAQLPSGGNVTAGQAKIATGASSQTITQYSNKAIIDWQSFSIGAGNSVVFQQPGSSAVALNRVVGGNPSSILGSLSANGQIFLVNPNGIYFGRNAVLDTAGLVASTLDIRNEDFLNGNYIFRRAPGVPLGAEVLNDGTLRAREGGYVVLAGDRVANRYEGLVEARLGTVALGAGEAVTLDIRGDKLINFAVTQSTGDRLGGAANAGTLAADGGTVVMSAMAARDVAGLVVNNQGLIRATGVEQKDGAIILTGSGDVQSSGRLLASGRRGGSVAVQSQQGSAVIAGAVDATGTVEKGGRIEVTGERVGLFAGARLDASGNTGGGTVLVGGDAHGANPEVKNAQRTYVAADADIKADARHSGDGGKVVVWADGNTRFDGTISARGGANGGDGGWVEVSGKDTLAMRGDVDTRAPQGRTGSLLLDPETLTITDDLANTGGLDDELVPPSTDGEILAGVADDGVANTVSRGQLEAFNATTNITLEAAGLITVNDMVGNRIDLATGPGNSFTLRSTGAADGGIVFEDSNDEIRTAGGAINVRAEKPYSTFNAGTITNLGKLTSNGGAISVFSSAQDEPLTIGSAINAGSGTVTLQSSEATSGGTQNLEINAPVTGGTVQLLSADGISQTAAGVITATNLIVRWAEGDSQDSVQLTAASNAVTNLAASLAGTGTGTSSTVNSSFNFRGQSPGGVLNITSLNTVPVPGSSATTVNGVAGVNLPEGNLLDGSPVCTDLPGAICAPTFLPTTISGIGAAAINSATGEVLDADVTLIANDINIAQAVRAGPNRAVTIRPDSASRNINIGTNAANSLGITQSELNQITASVVRIGDTANAGTMTLSGSISAPSTWDTLSLKTGGALTQSGTLSVANLAVEAAGTGAVNLSNSSTALGSVAISSGGAVTYSYGSGGSGDLRVLSTGVDGVTGIKGTAITLTSAAGQTLDDDLDAGTSGSVTLTASAGVTQAAGSKITAGNLKVSGSGTFSLDQAGNDIDAVAGTLSSGSLSVTSASPLTVNTQGGQAGINVANGTVALTADEMTIGSGINVGATGSVTLKALGTARAVDLGTKTAGALGFTDAELDRITAGGGLTIGSSANHGAMVVSQAITPGGASGGLTLINGTGGMAVQAQLASNAGNSALTLDSAGTISNTGGGFVQASTLTTRSAGGTTLSHASNSVSGFSATNTGAGDIILNNSRSGTLSVSGISQGSGNISVATAGGLDVNTAAIATAANGNIALTAGGGAMTLGHNITAGGVGRVRLSSTAGVSQTAGVITADGLELTGSGSFSLLSNPSEVVNAPPPPKKNFSYNNVNTLAANISGALSYLDQDELTIGTVGGTSGVTTGNGNFTLTTGGPLQLNNSTQAVLASDGGTLNIAQNINAGSGIVSLTVNNAAITQTGGAVTASTLQVASGGAATLEQAGNNVATVAATTGGAFSYTDVNALSVGVTGIASGGAVTLKTGGALSLTQDVKAGGSSTISLNPAAGGISQTGGKITGGKLLLTGAGPFNLSQTANNVKEIAGSFSGNLNYVDNNDLIVGTAGAVTGLTSTNSGDIDVSTFNGDLTVNEKVASGSTTPLTGTRGRVSVVANGAGGASADLTLKADVLGADVRLSADNEMSQTAGKIEASSIVLGSMNTPTLQYYGIAPIIDELVINFGARKECVATGVATFCTNVGDDTVINRNLIANRIILRGLIDGGSVQMGSGFGITATDLVLAGYGTFNLGNSGNDIGTLAAVRFSEAASRSIVFRDNNSFAVGNVATKSLGTIGGLNNNATSTDWWYAGGWLYYVAPVTSTILGGNVTLTAAAGSLGLQNFLATGGTAALSATNGITQSGGTLSAGSLRITGSGNVDMVKNNSVGTFAANVSNASAMNFAAASAFSVGTVGSTTGVTVAGPGALDVNITSFTDNLVVSQPISVITAGNSATARLRLAAGRDVRIGNNITVTGGSAGTANGAALFLMSEYGGIYQTGGTINVTDNGPATSTAAAPHKAVVDIRSGHQTFPDVAAQLGIGTCQGLVDGDCGVVALNNINVTSTNGSAWLDVIGPGGVTVNGVLKSTGQTAPRIKITADVSDSGDSLLSSRNVTINNAVTVTQTSAADVNNPGNEVGGLVISGNSISTSTSGNLTSNSRYGVSVSAQNHETFRANVSTTSTDGVSLSTSATFGTIQTANGASINASTLGLTADRDVGIFNLKTNIDTLTVLGGRAVTIDNGAHGGALTATVLGRISEASTNPQSGAAIDAVDKPVGALSLTTGGELTIFSLNNNASRAYGLNGGNASRSPLILVANKITETPGAFNTASWTDVTLRPYNASNAIEVRAFPTTEAAGVTYYLAGPNGLLNQFHQDARLLIGGPDYEGNIYIGSTDEFGFSGPEQQFNLKNMEVTFQTDGRVYNRFSGNQDSPTSWSVPFLFLPPYKATPLCPVFGACISDITSTRIYIQDSYTGGTTRPRNIYINGTAPAATGPAGPVSGGGSSGSDDGGGGGGSSGGGASSDAGTSPAGDPGGGGDSGSTTETTTTTVVDTGSTPADTAPTVPADTADPGAGGTGGATLADDSAPGPDGGSGASLAGSGTDDDSGSTFAGGPGTTGTGDGTSGTGLAGDGPTDSDLPADSGLADGSSTDGTTTDLVTDTTGTGGTTGTGLSDGSGDTGGGGAGLADGSGVSAGDGTGGAGDSGLVGDGSSGGGSGTGFADGSDSGGGIGTDGTGLAGSGDGSGGAGSGLAGGGDTDSGLAGSGDGGGSAGSGLAGGDGGAGGDGSGSGGSGLAGGSDAGGSDSGLIGDGSGAGGGGAGSSGLAGSGDSDGGSGTGLAGDGSGGGDGSGDTGFGLAGSGDGGGADSGLIGDGSGAGGGGAGSSGLAGSGDSGGGSGTGLAGDGGGGGDGSGDTGFGLAGSGDSGDGAGFDLAGGGDGGGGAGSGFAGGGGADGGGSGGADTTLAGSGDAGGGSGFGFAGDGSGDGTGGSGLAGSGDGAGGAGSGFAGTGGSGSGGSGTGLNGEGDGFGGAGSGLADAGSGAGGAGSGLAGGAGGDGSGDGGTSLADSSIGGGGSGFGSDASPDGASGSGFAGGAGSGDGGTGLAGAGDGAGGAGIGLAGEGGSGGGSGTGLAGSGDGAGGGGTGLAGAGSDGSETGGTGQGFGAPDAGDGSDGFGLADSSVGAGGSGFSGQNDSDAVGGAFAEGGDAGQDFAGQGMAGSGAGGGAASDRDGTAGSGMAGTGMGGASGLGGVADNTGAADGAGQSQSGQAGSGDGGAGGEGSGNAGTLLVGGGQSDADTADAAQNAESVKVADGSAIVRTSAGGAPAANLQDCNTGGNEIRTLSRPGDERGLIAVKGGGVSLARDGGGCAASASSAGRGR